MKNIFNTEATYGDTEIFFGDPPGVVDTIHQPHPELKRLYDEAISFMWNEGEFSFESCRNDFDKMDHSAEILQKTILWQWEADSVVSRALLPLFAPFITDPTCAACFSFNNTMEMIHSITYSEIVRNSFKNPKEVLENLHNEVETFNRLSKVGEVLEDLYITGHKYSLNQISIEEAFPSLYLGLVAVYCLEALSFISSFAITFGVCETGRFQAIGQAVKKIANDELYIHASVDLYCLKHLETQSKLAHLITPELKEKAKQVVEEVEKSEFEWTDYLFEGKSIPGLTPNLIKDWATFNAQNIKTNLGIEHTKHIKSNPIPWINSWITGAIQAAPMEQDITSYVVGAIDNDLSSLDDLDLDF